MAVEEPFYEIRDAQNIVDNLAFRVKTLRLILRYSVRLLGLDASLSLFKILENIFLKLKKSKINLYSFYLIKINLFRLLFLQELSKNNYLNAIKVKISWAEYVCENSISRYSRFNARSYIRFMQKEKLTNLKLAPLKETRNEKGENDKDIYIYGPNSAGQPNLKYKDYTLILLKPYPEVLTEFRKKTLFINSFYFNNAVKNSSLREEIPENYEDCFVSCRMSKLPKGFTRTKFPSQGHIASSMALGRVLYNFILSYGAINCVIEGFDLYLNQHPYSNVNYHKLSRKKDGTIEEQDFVMSLAEHDYIYNFFLLKDLISKVNLVDSEDFKTIMQMSWQEYAKKLHAIRDFKTLRNI